MTPATPNNASKQFKSPPDNTADSRPQGDYFQSRSVQGGSHLQFQGPTYLNVFSQPGNYTVNTNFGGNSVTNPFNRRVNFASGTFGRPYGGDRNDGMNPPRMPEHSSPYPRNISRDDFEQ